MLLSEVPEAICKVQFTHSYGYHNTHIFYSQAEKVEMQECELELIIWSFWSHACIMSVNRKHLSWSVGLVFFKFGSLWINLHVARSLSALLAILSLSLIPLSRPFTHIPPSSLLSCCAVVAKPRLFPAVMETPKAVQK